MLKSSYPAEVLIVEDNPGDARLAQEVLRQGKVSTRVSVAEDGEKALAFVRREAPFEDSPRPDLILLDLNMPRKNGREVLGELKSDADLRTIPVVVFTTSDAESDILECYRSHANCYIRKPVNLDGYLNIISAIEDFWLRTVRLPSLSQ